MNRVLDRMAEWWGIILIIVLVVVLVLFVASHGIGASAAPHYFNLYKAAFEECMKSELFSRQECLTVAHGMLTA